MKFENPYLEKIDKFELLQRWIIVQSILYYEMNFNLVEDKVFDDNCRQLVKMIEKYPKSYKKTYYHYCMYDFDGSTGFDLADRLNDYDRDYLFGIASYLKRQFIGVSDGKKKRQVL